MPHNPVPFDFVPFSHESPLTGKKEEWENAGGTPISGRIDYTLNVKTPLHIVGDQPKNQQKEIVMSSFLRRHGRPLIPGASLKGMLRAFVEALTNSWVSQATDNHPAVYKKQTNTFTAFSPPEANTYGPVIPERLHPKFEGNEIDLATFLFGAVAEGKGEAYPSRLIFEDITIPDTSLDRNLISLPDVPGDAFMGGPKPRINNWWYFKPRSIKRKVYERHINTDFMGSQYRGRKFYYHQKPEHVLAWYANPKSWPQPQPLRSYPVETVKAETTLSGKIYFNALSPKFLDMVLLSLNSETLAHKLGYGQAFGLGSVKIRIDQLAMNNDSGFDLDEEYFNLKAGNWNNYHNYIDANALSWLRRILHFDEKFIAEKTNIFTYPAFSTEFRKLVSWDEATAAAMSAGAKIIGSEIELSSKQARDVAVALLNQKKTIDFRLYQEKSCLWDEIIKRG